MFSFLLETLDKPFQHPIIDPCFIGAVAYAADVAEQTVAAAWDQLIAAVLVGVTTIISGIGVYALALVRTWVKSKTAKIKNDELRAAADFAMQRLDHIVTNVVKEIQQTKPTGEPLTQEKAKAMLKSAYGMVKAQVTDETMEIVKTVIKNSDRYIVTKIEAAVGEQKAYKPTGVTP